MNKQLTYPSRSAKCLHFNVHKDFVGLVTVTVDGGHFKRITVFSVVVERFGISKVAFSNKRKQISADSTPLMYHF